MSILLDKVVLIVGAAGGLGRSHALACARAGAKLVLCDAGCAMDGSGFDSGPLYALAEQVAQVGPTPVCHHGRIEDGSTRAALLDLAVSKFGRLDGLVFTAGAVRDRPLLQLSDEDLDVVLDTQVRSAIRMTRDSARTMRTQGSGSIVLTIGSTALLGAQRQTNQAAAAGAIAAFVRSAALDLRRHGVRINALAALARTRINGNLPMFQSIHQGSMTAAQVSPTVVHLLSDASTHVSGDVIGAAGARLYGIRTRETTGHFFQEEFDAEQVADVFDGAMRP